MHATAFVVPRKIAGRLFYAGLAAFLLGAVVYEVALHGVGYWQLAAFALGPDLALVYGASAGLERGRLHPRAVPLYNLLHRFWLPVVLLALASVGLVSPAYVVGALAWCLHVSLDRAVGYGLRTRDGFQRP